MPHGVVHNAVHGPTHGAVRNTATALSMAQVAAGGAAATSVAFGTHQAGDVIIVIARRGNATPASIPAAGGTVPTWITVESGGSDGFSLVTVYAVATAGTTTSGTFTNAGQLSYLIIRPNLPVTLGAHSTGNAASTETIVYPALTRQSADGYCVRTAMRGVADSEVANAPTGWTNRQVQPSGAGALQCIHTQDSAASNPTLDTVNTTGTPTPYRAHTFEFKST